MQRRSESVINALEHRQARSLPRGELFISRDFLDHYFYSSRGNYLKQLKLAAHSLELSLIGIDLDPEWSQALLSAGDYKELEGYFTVGSINGPVSGLVERHGFFKAMTSTHNNPSLLPDLASGMLKDIENKVSSARTNGFGAIAIADDIAGNKGLFFPVNYFIDAVFPFYKKISEIIKDYGMFAFFHSDGDMSKVIELLIHARYDCLHPVDNAAGMNIYKLMEEFGGKISFMGHIDIMSWSESRIKDEIINAERAFVNGGLIIGSACGISMNTIGRLNALYPGCRKENYVDEKI